MRYYFVWEKGFSGRPTPSVWAASLIEASDYNKATRARVLRAFKMTAQESCAFEAQNETIESLAKRYPLPESDACA